MATKKYLELKEFSAEELQNELNVTQEQYGKMKFEHAIRGLENPLTLREVRRDIARLKTEVRRRELGDGDSTVRTKIRARRRKNK
jgi:large subunit ribosomal protein L29